MWLSHHSLSLGELVGNISSQAFLYSCGSATKSYLTLWHHGLQHTKLLCPFLSPGICSNFCPLSWWFYLTILSSAIPFSSCLQSFPASGSFLNNSLFTSDGQSIGVSASAFSIMDGKTVSILLRCFLKRIYRCWSLEAIQKETRRKVIRNATGDMDRAATLSFQSCK